MSALVFTPQRLNLISLKLITKLNVTLESSFSWLFIKVGSQLFPSTWHPERKSPLDSES